MTIIAKTVPQEHPSPPLSATRLKVAIVSDVDALAADAAKYLRRAVVAIDDLKAHQIGDWGSTEAPAIVRRLERAVTNARRFVATIRAEERAQKGGGTT